MGIGVDETEAHRREHGGNVADLILVAGGRIRRQAGRGEEGDEGQEEDEEGGDGHHSSSCFFLLLLLLLLTTVSSRPRAKKAMQSLSRP